ncbi:GntR family transcriptional regulator [Streptomyces sp. NPDC050743]|uniref:GntR family transcriptional regulator n=1 Tax=Streptomyces sp. NPDC050743 TaxID=3365634 RepID=UPI0037A0CE6B
MAPLRTRVSRERWGTGTRPPSRARLAEEYGAGRNVVQRAVDRLIAEGLPEGRAGSGTYVRTPRERPRMLRSRPPRPSPGGSPSNSRPAPFVHLLFELTFRCPPRVITYGPAADE